MTNHQRRNRFKGEPRNRFDLWFPGGVRGAFWWLLVPIVATFTIIVGLSGYRADLAAHQGVGVRGIFTAENETCGRSDCTWSGIFRAPGDVRQDVSYTESDPHLSAGQQIPALDAGAGNAVYPLDGGPNWWLTPALTSAAVIALGFWVRWTVRIRRRDTAEWRRRSPRPKV